MRKIWATILSVCVLGLATLLPTAGVFFPDATNAFAEAPDEKICTAATENLTAVAYGNQIYLFDSVNGGVWQSYVHTETISRLSFHGSTLYFVDKLSATYALAASAYTPNCQPQKTQLTCSAFTVHGDNVYFVQQDWIYEAPLDDLSAEQPLFSPSFPSSSIAYFEGALYYLYGRNYLYAYDLTTSVDVEVSSIPSSTAMAVADGNFYFLTTTGELYGYSLTDLQANNLSAPLLHRTGSACAGLSADGAVLYFVQDGKLYTYEAGAAAPVEAPQNAYATANEIPLGDVQSQLLQATTATVAQIQTKENALLLAVDVNASQTHFQTLSVKRDSVSGLVLYQDATYTLFARYEDGYKTYLTANGNVDVLATGYTPFSQTGYASGDGKLYKYPLLTSDFPALYDVERNQALEIVGQLEGLDGDYYAVRAGDAVGYLPATHVRLFEGTTPPATQLALGERENGTDAVWRLAYLLLGGVALCILADFLILRKQPKDD